MSQDSPQLTPVGSPRVTVNLDAGKYGEKVEQIQIDSNRISAPAEARQIWGEGLHIPARAVDLLLQSATMIAGSGFTVSLLRALPFIPELLALIAIGLMLLTVLSGYAYRRFPELRFTLGYHSLMVCCGLILGVLL